MITPSVRRGNEVWQPILTNNSRRKGVGDTKRRTEITVETSRVLVIGKCRRSLLGWCSGCGQRVRMVTPEEAAMAAGTSARAIYRLVEANELHFTETPDARLFICLNSLPE